MATFKTYAVPVRFVTRGQDYQPGGYRIMEMSFSIGGPRPVYGAETVEVKSLADCVAAFERVKSEALAHGKSFRMIADLQSGRKPNGFDAAIKIGGALFFDHDADPA